MPQMVGAMCAPNLPTVQEVATSNRRIHNLNPCRGGDLHAWFGVEEQELETLTLSTEQVEQSQGSTSGNSERPIHDKWNPSLHLSQHKSCPKSLHTAHTYENPSSSSSSSASSSSSSSSFFRRFSLSLLRLFLILLPPILPYTYYPPPVSHFRDRNLRVKSSILSTLAWDDVWSSQNPQNPQNSRNLSRRRKRRSSSPQQQLPHVYKWVYEFSPAFSQQQTQNYKAWIFKGFVLRNEDAWILDC